MKKDLSVSCDETKHETTSPEQDHSITSARSNGWAECRDKKVLAPSRRRRMSLDIPFYRTWPLLCNRAAFQNPISKVSPDCSDRLDSPVGRKRDTIQTTCPCSSEHLGRAD